MTRVGLRRSATFVDDTVWLAPIRCGWGWYPFPGLIDHWRMIAGTSDNQKDFDIMSWRSGRTDVSLLKFRSDRPEQWQPMLKNGLSRSSFERLAIRL